jgi:pyruvate dehydrogenase E2 component (dihydrolipoamide acetyltransferase)
MTQLIEVKVPDIGDFTDIPVIELNVKVDDTIAVDDSICTLESDKATMDVPSSVAGVVKEILVAIGSKVSEGTVLVKVEAGAGAAAAAPQVTAPAPAAPVAAPAPTAAPTAPVAAAVGGIVEVKVPDIGDFDAVPIIELAVKVGDTLAVDDTICTLESDKATMDVPSSAAGVVKEVLVKVGDKVGEGAVLVKVESAAATAALSAPAVQTASAPAPTAAAPAAAVSAPAPAAPTAFAGAVLPAGSKAHASPSVRAYARELGADLGKVPASGPKSRITKEDVTRYVKGIVTGAVAAPGATAGGGVTGGGTLDLLPWPKVDFAKFGPIEAKPLPRIKKISGANLARNWVMIPHVTQFDEADITDLEAFRVQMNKENEKSGGAKLTMLAFLIKACVAGLKKYPEFNASLDGDNLVLKQYFHIGFAADTPNGLVVPVIRDCDKKGLLQIAQEMGDLAKKARDGKLGPADMTGGCFSISSLGGIGGTAFTPIINAPEVAILGVSKTQTKPVWDGKAFVPKQMLPLSLSYDHRVIDGAAAARFTAYLGQVMADFRRIFL